MLHSKDVLIMTSQPGFAFSYGFSQYCQPDGRCQINIGCAEIARVQFEYAIVHAVSETNVFVRLTG
jgi:hypothetical protein